MDFDRKRAAKGKPFRADIPPLACSTTRSRAGMASFRLFEVIEDSLAILLEATSVHRPQSYVVNGFCSCILDQTKLR